MKNTDPAVARFRPGMARNLHSAWTGKKYANRSEWRGFRQGTEYLRVQKKEIPKPSHGVDKKVVVNPK